MHAIKGSMVTYPFIFYNMLNRCRGSLPSSIALYSTYRSLNIRNSTILPLKVAYLPIAQLCRSRKNTSSFSIKGYLRHWVGIKGRAIGRLGAHANLVCCYSYYAKSERVEISVFQMRIKAQLDKVKVRTLNTILHVLSYFFSRRLVFQYIFENRF